ncbi:DUF485 domain-containing protein [Paraburkholderia sp. GAS348]|jgi:uncharacterized membrane protein (DUF485 family)|uniref:DUF485 domain-containing protein n=1 Tax=Paraburkholderia sp. GAS348 TaxID=3035132 RepID=UPI003D19BB4C
MSQIETHEKIRRNPKFAMMVRKRTRLAIMLSVIVLVPYYAFMMITAFSPELLSRPLAAGAVMTVGWPLATIMIVGAWMTTGVYILRANGEFDALNKEILEEASK